MKTYSITNHTEVLSLFEICLITHSLNYQQVKLCIAPTPKGEVVAYLRGSGGPWALALRTDDGWFFGREAFGDEALDRLLSMMVKEGITANAIRSAATRGESYEIAEARHSLADAIEETLAEN